MKLINKIRDSFSGYTVLEIVVMTLAYIMVVLMTAILFTLIIGYYMTYIK